jgi:hypothetical protein
LPIAVKVDPAQLREEPEENLLRQTRSSVTTGLLKGLSCCSVGFGFRCILQNALICDRQD